MYTHKHTQFPNCLTPSAFHDESQCSPNDFAFVSLFHSGAPCTANWFAASNGSTVCQECPDERLTSIPGSAQCDRAVEGYFVDPAAATLTVKKCPSHATCPGDLVLPIPDKGFWSDPKSSVAKVYECSRETCKGAAKVNNSCWIAGELEKEDCNIDKLLCEKGSEGPLCGSCSSHYTYDSITSTCEPCGGDPSASDVGLFVVMSVLIVVTAMVCLRPPKRLKTVLGAVVDFLHGFDSGSLKIGWNTYQIVAAIPLTSNVDYPEPFETWLHDLSFMSFDFLSSDCLFIHQSYYQKVYIVAFLPLIGAICIVLVFAVVAQRRPGLRKRIKTRWLPYSLLLLSCKNNTICVFKYPS